MYHYWSHFSKEETDTLEDLALFRNWQSKELNPDNDSKTCAWSVICGPVSDALGRRVRSSQMEEETAEGSDPASARSRDLSPYHDGETFSLNPTTRKT